MIVKDLGQMPESIVLFGGAYGNLQAVQAVTAIADGRPMINTGDMVAYCADGADVVRALAEVPCVAGNVEKQLASGADNCGCGFEAGTVCDLLSAGWYAHAKASLGAAELAVMRACPDVIVFAQAGLRFAVLHGGVSDVARFLWSVSPEAAFAEELRLLTAACGPVDAVVAGHSGIAFQKDVGGVTWINAGVIGMPPNDGGQSTEYVVLQDGQPHFHRLAYDAAGARAAMVSAGLTQGYHDALITGRWPSEDVLPQALRTRDLAV